MWVQFTTILGHATCKKNSASLEYYILMMPNIAYVSPAFLNLIEISFFNKTKA